MRSYFLRRLLLIPPTLFGITIIVFLITRVVPGGPVERALMEIQQVQSAAGGGSGGSSFGAQQALSEEQLQQLKEYYGFDKPPIISYFHWLGNVLRGDLGSSYRYNEPVWEIIRSRFPISIFYGLLSLTITYLVCIPLGIVKAIRHRTLLDNFSSILIFTGYAIPGYVLGALLVVFFAARLEWFPMGGFTSMYFDELTFWGKVKDLFHHAVLPLCSYLIGSFALVTLLMKNHLMDNLAADYIRTAVSKGVSFPQTVLRHALRNSLIPIATTFGQNIVLLVGGSFLIETIFDINGFGLLGFTAILDRDYPIVMGVLLLSSLLLLLGNIISDVIVALIDPRVRFS
jgi:microcin C transport system permease protein